LADPDHLSLAGDETTWVRGCEGAPSWIHPSILKYERDLFAGRIRCPFKIDRKFVSGEDAKPTGQVAAAILLDKTTDSFLPIALTPTGKIKC